MSIYRIGKCDYCGEVNKILRTSPYMADIANMCEEDWDMTQEEYKNSTGEYIVDFKSDIKAYEEIVKNKKQKIQGKNIQQLIEYLESIKEQSGEDTEVRVDGQVIKGFEDYMEVNHVKDYIDFITPSFKSM